jgi:hypothetical protein
MDHQFKEDRKMVPTLKNSSISPRKNISCTYLIHRLFDRGRATSKHGGGGRYDAIFGVQRGVFFKKREREEKESSKAMYGASKVKVSQEKNE